MNPFTDPTTGEWVASFETRNEVGEISRQTEWFDNYADAVRFIRTGFINRTSRQD